MSFELFVYHNGPMLTKTKKKKKNAQIQISPIFIQLWYRPFLEVCMSFWEWTCYVLSEKYKSTYDQNFNLKLQTTMTFDVFLPYGPMLMKPKKKS